MRADWMQYAFLLLGCLAAANPASAQSSIGSVATENAQVQGLVIVSAGRATIQNNGTVAAGPRTSEVLLSRGGMVRVCTGSTVAFSQATGGRVPATGSPLLIALQKGATEIQLRGMRTDSVLTPDLRIELSGAAPLDLRLRMNGRGDTCVENLGKDAPMLHVTEQFGGAGYLVKPGQRVLFEHGSVREVVDRESTNCGCPKPGKGSKDDFPEEVSAGLVQPQVPAAPAGETHAQVSAGIDYDGATKTASGPPAPDGSLPVTTGSPASASTSSNPSQTSVPRAHSSADQSSGNPFSAVGRFFRRLFGGR